MTSPLFPNVIELNSTKYGSPIIGVINVVEVKVKVEIKVKVKVKMKMKVKVDENEKENENNEANFDWLKRVVSKDQMELLRSF